MNNIYSVWQVNSYIHTLFERDIRLRAISVKGELSNVKYHSAGHIYFTLKDEKSAIACVMFAGSRRGLTFKMTEGQEVIVTGSISTYERDGRYQIYASSVLLSGSGALYEKYEKLKNELLEMGMFDECYKKPIPQFINTLGIVTAPTGAAIRDILNISLRRFPYLQIVLFPAKVQGEDAAKSIAEGIKALDEYGVDCIIAGRGGGSIEDLWAFNEEIVARAIFDCQTPVISAVGHETDTTIADWVADLRAPTPSAAAELAVFDYESFINKCSELGFRLTNNIKRRIFDKKNTIKGYKVKLAAMSPQSVLRQNQLRLTELNDALKALIDAKLKRAQLKAYPMSEKLTAAFDNKLKRRKHMVALLAERLNGLSPLLKLSQGYSLTEDESGRAVVSQSQVKSGDVIKVHVYDGSINALVKSTERINRNGREKE